MAALQIYSRLAITGIETAQYNAAYILSHLSLCPSKLMPAGNDDDKITPEASNSSDCEVRSLYLFSLSADQSNGDAYRRMGDMYYYGQAGLPVNKREAAVHYQVKICKTN